MKTCRHPELTALAYAGYAAIKKSMEAEEAKGKEAAGGGEDTRQSGEKSTAAE